MNHCDALFLIMLENIGHLSSSTYENVMISFREKILFILYFEF